MVSPLSPQGFPDVRYNPYMPKEQKMQLNDNQLSAINHKSGPLLVVAGAGTGKTRVITERIKHLIQNQNISPSDILALTFTEKAAQEMQNRIGDVMPLGYEEPWVSTFHGFADRILKAEGLEFGLDPAYKILSGPNQWILLRKHLFKLKLSYFKPLGNPTKFLSAILKFISRLQDENVSAEEFELFVQNNKAEEQQRWEELSYIYSQYQQLKIDNSKLDFGDLIMWTLKLFEERPAILKKYQDQFKHILVDEFQDTNYAQYLLVKKLFPTADNGECSLLVVGDDSQSIYKFRGAAVSNILEFMRDYPKSAMITLINNYRSSQNILDPAYALIKNNNPDTLESKLGISKELIGLDHGSVKLRKKHPHPEVIQAPTQEDEVEFAVQKIYELLAKEPQYTYKDIAILARANSQLEPYVLAFKKYGIPYQLVGNRGLYDQDEIRDVLALIKVVVNPKDSISLYRVLNIDALGISQDTITDILTQSRYKKVDVWDTVQKHEDENLSELVKIISVFQDKITKVTPVDFVYNLINQINYVRRYLENETLENNLSIKNLDLFLNLIKTFEVDYRNENKEIPTIINLIDHVDMLIEAGDNPAQAELEDIDTVNLLTVHSAKGLEFPVVFMTNLISGRFPTSNRSDPIEIPEKLINETLPTGNEHIQEERRLFYVGMTRAQDYLFLTFAKNYGGKRETTPSGYLAETQLEINALEPMAKNAPTQDTLFGVNSAFRDPIFKKIKYIPDFLSFSQVDAYKTCPLMYKYRYVLNVPTPPSHALSFGITIHDTLRDFHSALLFKKVSLDDFYEMYQKNWQPLGYMDEDHRKERYEAGKIILKKYYDQNIEAKQEPLAVEKSFNLKIGGTKFYGRIDRIDPLDGDGVEIIDYKTGNVKEQKLVDKDDQVAFYAIAVKDALNLNPKKLSYYFVETGEKISTTRTEKQLEDKKVEVAELVEKMKNGEFGATPGMHCEWCDFKDLCPFAFRT